jgi:hypothetical protein
MKVGKFAKLSLPYTHPHSNNIVLPTDKKCGLKRVISSKLQQVQDTVPCL